MKEMQTTNLTTSEFGMLLGVTSSVATGMVCFLRDQGFVKEVGKKKTGLGKGRTAAIYAFDHDLTLPMGELVAKAAETAAEKGESVTEQVQVPDTNDQPSTPATNDSQAEPDPTEVEIAAMSEFLDKEGNV